MAYGLIKHCKMSWRTERHTFTFNTGGSYLCALDSLSDVTGSLEKLYKHIRDNHDHGDDIPFEYKVVGGCCHTYIKEA